MSGRAGPFVGARVKAVVLWVGVAAGVLIMAGLAVSYAHALSVGLAGPTRSDFLPTYAAATLAAHRDAHFYNLPALQAAETHLALPGRLSQGVLPFFYPPFFALLVAPLTVVPFGVAFWIWGFLNLGMLLAVVRWTAQRLPVGPAARLLVAIGILSSIPAFGAVVQGQVSPLLSLCTAGGIVALGRRRDVLAGMLLACLTIKVTYVLPVVLVLLVAGKWRACAALVGTALLLAVTSTVVLGPGSETGYLHILLSATQWQRHHVGFNPSVNESLEGFWSLILPSSAARVAWLLCSAALLGYLATLARRHGADPRVLGLAIIGALLIGPHVLVHDFLLLLIPVAYCCHRNTAVPTHVAAAWLALYAGTVLSLLHPAGIPIQWATLALLALGASLAASLRADTESKESTIYPSGAVA